MTHAKTVELSTEDEEAIQAEPVSAAASDHGRPASLLFGASPEATAPSSSFSLRKILRPPTWRWSKLAVTQAELAEAQEQLAILKRDIALHVDARQEMKHAHAATLVRLEAAADARLEDTRRDAATALETLRIELERQSSADIQAAVRATSDESARIATEVAEQHAAALAAMRAELNSAEARIAQLEQDLPGQLEAVRHEAKTAHNAEVWALTAQAATQLETARRDAAAALAAQAARLEEHAIARVDAAVRTFQGEAAQTLTDTVRQHDSAIAAVRAELRDAETRCAHLERALPAEADRVRREEQEAHAARVAAIEEDAAATLASTRRDVDTALAMLAEELETKASAHLEATLRAARDEAARAAADTAQQHATTLAAMRATLEDVAARKAKLEHDLPALVDAARREAGAVHGKEAATLRMRAAAQVEAAVRDAHDEAARATADMARLHEAALAQLRAEQEETDAQRARIAQDLDLEVARHRETSRVHAAEIAALRSQLEAQVTAAVGVAREEAARVLMQTTQHHATAIAAARAELDAAEARRATVEHDIPVQLEAARREAAAAHAAEVAALRVQATAHIEVAVREVRDEAARAAADTAVRHTAALAAIRHELDEVEARRMRLEQDLAVQTVLRREAGIAHAVELSTLRADAATQVETRVRDVREEAAREAAAAAGRHALALETLRAELEQSEARRTTLEDDLPGRVDAARRDADAAHASTVAALRAQAAAQVDAAVRETRDEAARAAEAVKAQHEVAVATVRMDARAEGVRMEAQLAELRQQLSTSRRAAATGGETFGESGRAPIPAALQRSTVRQMALVTGALILSGFAGTLMGWSVAFWGILH